MIVPNAHIKLDAKSHPIVFQQNWAFSQQWQAFKPQERKVLELNVGASAKDFLDTLRQGAAIAHGRDMILFIGHGGAADFRGLTETVFDTVPENGPLSTHKLSITRGAFEFETIAEKKDGKWVPKPRQQGTVKVTEPQSKIDSLAPRFEMLKEAGPILQKGGIKRLILLSCNVGKDPAFVKDLARFLGVSVHAYNGLVAVAEVNFTVPDATKEMIWIMHRPEDPSFDQPVVTTRDQTCFHEVPNPEVPGP